MQRRALLAGVLAAGLPSLGTALAQTSPLAPPPPAAAPDAAPRRHGDAGSGRAANRPRLPDMDWADMNPRQRQRVGQMLGGPDGQPLPPDQAQRRWASMGARERRQALRAYNQARRSQRPPRGGEAPPPPPPG